MKLRYTRLPGIIVGFLFSLFVQKAQAQPTPFEGANVILISTDLADKEAYLTIGRILSEQGILFTAASDCLVFPLPITREGEKGANLIGQVSVNAGLVKLLGVAQAPASTEANQAARLVPMSVGYTRDKRKASLSAAGFLYLNEIARKLYRPLHGMISYKMQPQTENHTASF